MIRSARPGDEIALTHLWQTVFGDREADIARFLSALYRPEITTVWAEGDQIRSAVYLVDAGISPLPDGRRLPTAYLYAFATLPDYQGRGIGTQVIRTAIAGGFDHGFRCNILRPAEASLFPYYARLGYGTSGAVAQGRATLENRAFSTPGAQVMSTNFSTYLAIRNQYLPPFSTEYADSFLQYVALTAQVCGGGLYRLDMNGQSGCAVAEIRGEELFIREILLPPPLLTQGVQALLAHFEKSAATYRTPTELAPAQSAPFILAAFPPGENIPLELGYFPFVLD
ncbi:MAG: GNAT family N-acetyltransferase [Oscillospiraceae bacterium]|nr:GNAT family N-acetyltransferase [Oscillospiraceae bacterium]